MTEKQKLILALIQVENLFSLLKENSYENFLHSKLHKVKYELQRQLSHLTNTQQQTTIKEQTTN